MLFSEDRATVCEVNEWPMQREEDGKAPTDSYCSGLKFESPYDGDG